MSDDFIERMNGLWGDDEAKPNPDDGAGGDGKEYDTDRKGKNSSGEQVFSGLDFLPMPIPDARNRPPTDPLQWKTFKETYGVLQYESPEQEFEQNDFVLNMQTMLYRWAGMGMEKRIFDLYSSDEARINRITVQAIKRRSHGLPDPKNPDDVAANNARQAQIALDRIDYLKHVLEQGIEITVEQYFRFREGGTVFKEAARPLSQSSRARIERDLRLWIETYRNITEQTGKKTVVEHGVAVSLADLLRDGMRQNGHTTPEGETIEALEAALNPALNPADTLEAEIVFPENTEVERRHDDK